jgi:hypothetical protein
MVRDAFLPLAGMVRVCLAGLLQLLSPRPHGCLCLSHPVLLLLLLLSFACAGAWSVF